MNNLIFNYLAAFVASLCFVSLVETGFSQALPADVYLLSSDAPRPTNAAKSILIRQSAGVKGVSVRAALAKIRLGRDATNSKLASFRGSENTFRKFVRFELGRLDRKKYPGLTMHASYTFKEGHSTGTQSETVELPADARSATVDLGGVVDVTGTRVSSYSSGLFSTTVTKSKNYVTDIVAVSVRIETGAGNVVFEGGWADGVDLPAIKVAAAKKSPKRTTRRPKPAGFPTPVRDWKGADSGVVTRGHVTAYDPVAGTITFVMSENGRAFEGYSVDKLSDEDRAYLDSLK